MADCIANDSQQEWAGTISTIHSMNGLVNRVSDGQLIAFAPISVVSPVLSIPIHGFYSLISWLYVLYNECGSTTVDFLSSSACDLQLASADRLRSHITLVNSFRTYLQHNLDPNKRRDLLKKQYCLDWVRKRLEWEGPPTSDPWPHTDQQWKMLLLGLVEEAEQFFQTLSAALNRILIDQARNETIKIWISRSKRLCTPFEYDAIIELTALDMGFKYLNPVALRKRYYERWNKRLALLKEGYDFKREVRLLVEQALLSEEGLPMPVSGDDIIKELGIPPGPEIRRLLTLAQRFHNERQCDYDEIMSALRRELGQSLESSHQ